MYTHGLLTRRQFLRLAVIGAGAYGLYRWFRFPTRNPDITRPKRLGTTFSQVQCRYLGLDHKEAFVEICALGFDVIRLCSYWNEIEPVEGVFNFRVLDWLLDKAQAYGVDVVLSVGMKAPRWPEFHFPDWVKSRYNVLRSDRPLDSDPALSEKALNFVQKVVEHARDIPCIQYWQVENEPMSRVEVAEGRYLSRDFVQREVELVRALVPSDRKILLTTAIHILPVGLGEDDQALEESLAMADAVGVNVYTKVPIGPTLYLEPLPEYWRRLARWQRRIKASGKEAWISEAQAEPWEYKKLVATDKAEYPSASPERSVELAVTLAQIGYDTVLLWGSEYWYWHKRHGFDGWWKAIEYLIDG